MKFYTMKQEKLFGSSNNGYRTLEEEIMYNKSKLGMLDRLVWLTGQAQARLRNFIPSACTKAVDSLDRQGGWDLMGDVFACNPTCFVLEAQFSKFTSDEDIMSILRAGYQRHESFKKELVEVHYQMSNTYVSDDWSDDLSVYELFGIAKTISDDQHGYELKDDLSEYLVETLNIINKLKLTIKILLDKHEEISHRITETRYRS